MAFRKFLSALGVNAPSVETVLTTGDVRPGDTVTGHVTVQGGGADVDIEHLTLELVVRAEERESDEHAWQNPYPVTSQRWDGPLRLEAGGTRTHEFALELPWETPLTHSNGRRVPGARAAVRTTLAIDNAVDRGDLDELAVHPLPLQQRLLDAYAELGFRLSEAEVKLGTVNGGHNQKSGHWQEFEIYAPPGRYNLTRLETVFIARADSLDLITGAHGPFPAPYAELAERDWTGWLDEVLRKNFGR
ncbi:sporulation protein [Allostreptomyces psammosilenae]|uniref:Sporulation-control protein n=1 Tax=Allostreptomyces psammosilenae TaxID=1892865 RepID=A0A852ZMJ0_9ACTN|nr:sporulation protein [Allostreptomyces psammosilenae]NYI03646.1 sporulation-control protein [Allostreptomyces psammosilenae]